MDESKFTWPDKTRPDCNNCAHRIPDPRWEGLVSTLDEYNYATCGVSKDDYHCSTVMSTSWSRKECKFTPVNDLDMLLNIPHGVTIPKEKFPPLRRELTHRECAMVTAGITWFIAIISILMRYV